MQAALATWAARDLPARLDVATTAKLLGFAVSDIQILMGVGKLTPLGDPALNDDNSATTSIPPICSTSHQFAFTI